MTPQPIDHHDRSRRSFLKSSAAAVAVLGPAAGLLRDARAGDEPQRAARVIDCHAHLHHHSRPSWEADDRSLIEVADRLGIDQLCCSILTPRRPATAAGFRECNRWLAEAMKRFPGRVLGYCYVNPGHQTEALEEIRR